MTPPPKTDTGNALPPGGKPAQPGATGGATGGATSGAASGGRTGALPKTGAAAAPTDTAHQRGSLAAPLPAPAAGQDQVLQITSSMLQQLLSSAIAASNSGQHREPPVPKFWEAEPAAWFQVFRGHYQQRNLTQVALFNALLPLVPASAVALCRPFVGSTAADVFDQVERLLLKRFEMSRMERGKALLECTSLGDRTPEEMLQHMRSLQPGEEEGTIFRYLFVSLLPDVVREVVATMDSLDDMAMTANSVLQSNAAARINALSLQDNAEVAAIRRSSGPRSPRSPRRPRPPPSAGSGTSGLCRTHSRYGQYAFRCDRPASCPMRAVTRVPGNGPAGRR